MSRYSDLQHFQSVRLVLICACLGLGMAVASSSLSVRASSFGNGQTQLEMNEEACKGYKQSDREMNQAYQTILRDYRKDRAFIAALHKAQLAWLRYRDAQLESVYPGDPSQWGSTNLMCRCGVLAELTKERTAILKRWVEGIEEGDVCTGSVRVK